MNFILMLYYQLMPRKWIPKENRLDLFQQAMLDCLPNYLEDKKGYEGRIRCNIKTAAANLIDTTIPIYGENGYSIKFQVVVDKGPKILGSEISYEVRYYLDLYRKYEEIAYERMDDLKMVYEMLDVEEKDDVQS